MNVDTAPTVVQQRSIPATIRVLDTLPSDYVDVFVAKTDAATDVRVSRRGAYLWIDGSILKIPLQLAQRIRRGVSLRG